MNGHRLVAVSVDGTYYAFMRTCPHEDADLVEGQIMGTRIRCTGHNYMFDMESGNCLAPSGGPDLWVIPVEVRGDDLCARLER
jgi:toluene monooxygenase system ferredoxin subunit